MAEEGAPTLYTTDDTGNYVEYSPPDPPAFKDTLPEEIRESEHLQDINDGSQLARYYVDLKKDYLAPPETADGYEFEKPEDFLITDDELANFKNIAFENGVNQKQFAEFMNAQAETQKKGFEALEKFVEDTRNEAETKLKQEWGDKYEQRLEAAKSILRHEAIADDEFTQFLEDTKYGDNPQVIKFFAKLSDLISEDAFNKPGTGDKVDSRPRTEDGRPMLKFPSMEQK